ncbi:MAG: hypothetical protein EOL95_07700 [Bacteroidia bacterium]|nr:hypothetical protein [Bacteroidia bacterium]
MSKTTSYLICLLLPFFAASCSIPSSLVEVPMMQQKGDAMVSAGFSYPLGVCVSGAYSPVNHLALQADAEFSFYTPTDVSVYPFNTHLSLGYYHKFGQHWVLENYYGGGYGQKNTHLTVEPYPYRSGFNANAFTQINFGAVNLKGNGEVGIAFKAAYYYYDSPITYALFNTNREITGTYSCPTTGHSIVLTPVFFFRFGWEHIRLGLQVNGNHNLTLSGSPDTQYPFNVILSVMYRF